MPRDYAKKPARRKPARPPIPGWVWMASGLTVGLFVAFLVYLDKQPDSNIDLPAAVQQTKQRLHLQDTRDVRKDATAKAPPGPAGKSADKGSTPRFQFYSILPELEVAVPDDELKREERQQEQRAVAHPGPTTPPPDGTHYVLQAGSFKQFKEADGFKARLALLGVQASIETVDINGTKWHRVRVGPFTDIKSLNQARARLHEHDIEPMVLKVKG